MDPIDGTDSKTRAPPAVRSLQQGIAADLIAVLVAVTSGEPRVLTIQDQCALPSGPFELAHRSLQSGLRRVLIKDNHVAIAGGVTEALKRPRSGVGHLVKIELEVDTLDQLREALDHGVDAVLLDNMDTGTLTEAVAMVSGRAVTEASGRITPATAPKIAATGVDLISIGWLTHSVDVLDIGLDFKRGNLSP
jgi:hypothetical protein